MIALLLLALSTPDPRVTPGALCSPADPDFHHVDVVGNFAVCRRHVIPTVRRTVFTAYGIRRARWNQYELDHLVPLCMGGSNAAENLWAEPLTHAHRKDVIEARLCRQLRAGKITQAAAVEQMRRFR